MNRPTPTKLTYRVQARVVNPLTEDLSGLFCSVRTRQHLLPSAAQHFSECSAAAPPCLIAPLSVSPECRGASMRRTAACAFESVTTNMITENPLLIYQSVRILDKDGELISSTDRTPVMPKAWTFFIKQIAD